MTRMFSGRMLSVISRLRQGIRGNAGNATLELSLSLSLLGVPLLLGTYESAIVVHDSIEVTNAAHAGAMYGMVSSSYASDNSGITTAAQDEASDFGAGLTVTPTTYYACSSALNGTQYSTQAAASAACPSGATNHYLQFVQVATSATLSLPVHMASLPSTITLSGTSVMEVEE